MKAKPINIFVTAILTTLAIAIFAQPGAIDGQLSSLSQSAVAAFNE